MRQSLKSDLINGIERQLGDLQVGRLLSRDHEQQFAKTLLLGVEKDKKE